MTPLTDDLLMMDWAGAARTFWGHYMEAMIADDDAAKGESYQSYEIAVLMLQEQRRYISSLRIAA